MQTITQALSSWRGSPLTESKTREIILQRFGPRAAELYDPRTNAMTYKNWLKCGRRVMKGQKSIPSITVIEKRNSKGEIEKKYAKTAHLFFIWQTEILNQQEQK